MASGLIWATDKVVNNFTGKTATLLIEGDNTYARIRLGKNLLRRYRNGCLCWYIDQNAAQPVVFLLWTGASNTWDDPLVIKTIYNPSNVTLSATLDGDNIKITGIGSWGYGMCIGINSLT